MSDSDFTIVIVDDQACPGCGAIAGHPDPALDFPNRPKVDNHWKCYNPACDVGFYSDGEIIEYALSDEDAAAMNKRIAAQVDAMMAGKSFVRVDDGSRPGIETYELR
jgi:hypothetical protein